MSKAVTTENKSRVFREVNTIVTVMAREITIFFKSAGSIIMSLAMPLMMMGLIGGNLMQNMTEGLDFEFGEFMLVGMLVSMMFMITTMGMTSLVDDRETNFNQAMLVSPVSRYSLVVGKICGAMFGAIVSIVGALLIGLLMGITLSIGQFLLILALSPLICLAGGALAMFLIGAIKNRRTANYVVTFITAPQIFLSGAIIPISNSSGILMMLSRIMPMTYCLDLARAVVYAGTPEYGDVVIFNPAINLTAIIGLTIICLVVGTILYVRSEKNR